MNTAPSDASPLDTSAASLGTTGRRPRIAVFGATGSTGRALLEAAAGSGHPATAYVRGPGRLGATPADRSVAGSAFDPATVAAAVAGADAVVIAYGLHGDGRTPLYTRGTELVIEAMRAQGVDRLIVFSEAAYPPHLRGLLPRLLAAVYRSFARPVIQQRRAQDALVEASGLHWTFIRPTTVTDRSARGIRPGLRAPSRMPSRTTYQDLAALVLATLTDTGTHGRTLYP